MIIEITTIIMNIIRDLLLCFGILFSFKTSKTLLSKHHARAIFNIKSVVFFFLSIAITSLTIAFITQDFMSISRIDLLRIISAALFLMANIFFIIAFAYFWHSTAKIHKLHKKEFLFFFGVVASVILWIKYLFSNVILPHAHLLPINEQIFMLLLPLTLALAFLLTLVIHPRYKAKVIQTPLWYISSAAFTYFLGQMIMFYLEIREGNQVLIIIKSFLLMISAFYFALGFFVASKKYHDRNLFPGAAKSTTPSRTQR
jgi:hypothetical protein